MKNKLIKSITLTMVCWLVLLGLPSLAIEEEMKEEAREAATMVQESSVVENRILSRSESGTRKALKFLPGGEALGDILFGSEAEKALEVQKGILVTNQNTLSQIRAMAKDAMRLKRKIEEIDRLKRESIRLGQHFSKSSYSKMAVALGEKALGISCNPSDYIPNTTYTRKLKRNLNMNYGREKRFLRGSQRFLKSSRKAFAWKDRSYKSTKTFQKKLVQATAYDRHVEAYVVSRNCLLAQAHEALADSLLKSNQELQAMIHDEKANMSAAEVIQTQDIMNKNVSKALDHKVKANALLKESNKISKGDQEKLAASQEHSITQELIDQELKALRNREGPSWIGSKQKEMKKNSKKAQK